MPSREKVEKNCKEINEDQLCAIKKKVNQTAFQLHLASTL